MATLAPSYYVCAKQKSSSSGVLVLKLSLPFCSQVVERRRTPAEIREEFERLQREREERRLQQRTNPKVASTASVGWGKPG